MAILGAEAVECNFDFCAKSCITVIAGVSAAGEKLPLWIICKDESDRCEHIFDKDPDLKRAIDSGRLFVVHSTSGWIDQSQFDISHGWPSENVAF
jgi:hypothetical protein